MSWLMSTLARLKALSPIQRTLLVDATAALAVASLVIAIVPFRRIAKFVARRPARAAPSSHARARIIRDVNWAVQAGARRAPWRSKCFEQSLAALWLLRRRGIPATLDYGVTQRAGQGLAAHVWVRAGDQDVVGCDNSSMFAELARLSAEA